MLAIEGLNTHYGASHVLQGVDLDGAATGRICSRCSAATASARRRRCAR